MLFSRPLLMQGQEEQGKITAKAIIKIYGMLHYDAVGISAYDLAAGVGFLKEASKLSKVPWLSANILSATDHKPVFKPSIIKKIGDIQVGIIGITDPAACKQKDNEVVIATWQQTLPTLIKEMNNSCDLLILLSSLPDKENQQIAKEMEGIHLILQNGSQNHPLQKVDNTLITNTGKKGKYLGELAVNWQPTKKWGMGKKEELHSARQKLDQINWRLKRLKRKGLPDKGAEGNPKLLRDYHLLDSAQKELKTTIATLENSKDELFCSYRLRFIALEKNMPEQPAVQKVVDLARMEVNKVGQKRKTIPHPPSLYIGAQRCASCHSAQSASWGESRHARSFQTLAMQKQQFNLDCLPCHVTGINDTNLRHALSLPEEQRQVGCEACHGAGTEHVKTQGKRAMPIPTPGSDVCLRCHTPEHSDDFNYQRDRHLVH